MTSSAVSVDASGFAQSKTGGQHAKRALDTEHWSCNRRSRGGRGARAAAVATRCARASRCRDGRSRAVAGPRQPRDDGLRRVREPAGRQRAVAGSARAVEMDRRARCRAHLRSAERACDEPRPARLAVSVRDRAAVGPQQPSADRRRGARSSACRRCSRRSMPRRGSVRCSVEDGRTVVQFTIAQGATLWLAIDPDDEAARLGSVDRPEHDTRRHYDDDLLHGLLAVRRAAVAGRASRRRWIGATRRR